VGHIVIEKSLDWAKRLLGWTPGVKHPDTGTTVFRNCYEQDKLRRILYARCRICDFVVSRDEAAVKELIYQCNNSSCECRRPGGSRAHQVCDICYALFHALYMNYQLKNMNYFRELDEKDEKDKNDFRRKDRLGL
jgi:DNA polymerase III delta prime subunit